MNAISNYTPFAGAKAIRSCHHCRRLLCESCPPSPLRSRRSIATPRCAIAGISLPTAAGDGRRSSSRCGNRQYHGAVAHQNMAFCRQHGSHRGDRRSLPEFAAVAPESVTRRYASAAGTGGIRHALRRTPPDLVRGQPPRDGGSAGARRRPTPSRQAPLWYAAARS